MEDKDLFKGISIDDGKWVEGQLLQENDTDAYIIPKEAHFTVLDGFFQVHGAIAIDINSKARCTSLPDKNGKLIFEKDIVNAVGRKWVVKWIQENGSFGLFMSSNEDSCFTFLASNSDYEIIGNLYDNPELLTSDNPKEL